MAFILFKYLIILVLFYCVKSEVKDRYYPRYHLAPPYGWMNDPNGFSIFQNEYHLFYQFNPYSSQDPGTAHWGHVKSNDLFNWELLPVAMYPDQEYDKNGVFSGSVLIEDDTMYAFYTGQVKYGNQSPDHTNKQLLATSTNGVEFTKYEGNPIIPGEEFQPNFRDPKVWKNGETYYMVLGNSFNNDTLGRVLLFTSKDKISWENVSVLGESNGTMGYMWECPDFFELDGKFVLLFSPQGIEPQGDKYRNLYQVGYFVGDFDYSTNKFTPTSDFRELDHGHDFYATQSTLDNTGRRIVIAWFDMWDQNYPEKDDGFTGTMTIPRELTLTNDGRLIQKPVKEIESIKGDVLRCGKAYKNEAVELIDNTGEIKIEAEINDLELLIESVGNSVAIKYDNKNKEISLDRGGDDGIRKTSWQPEKKIVWTIYVDASSIEVFCGEGEVTFSSRFFPEGPIQVRLGDKSEAVDMTVTSMKRTVPKSSQ